MWKCCGFQVVGLRCFVLFFIGGMWRRLTIVGSCFVASGTDLVITLIWNVTQRQRTVLRPKGHDSRRLPAYSECTLRLCIHVCIFHLSIAADLILKGKLQKGLIVVTVKIKWETESLFSEFPQCFFSETERKNQSIYTWFRGCFGYEFHRL